jgi:hypothetical protein
MLSSTMQNCGRNNENGSARAVRISSVSEHDFRDSIAFVAVLFGSATPDWQIALDTQGNADTASGGGYAFSIDGKATQHGLSPVMKLGVQEDHGEWESESSPERRGDAEVILAWRADTTRLVVVVARGALDDPAAPVDYRLSLFRRGLSAEAAHWCGRLASPPAIVGSVFDPSWSTAGVGAVAAPNAKKVVPSARAKAWLDSVLVAWGLAGPRSSR